MRVTWAIAMLVAACTAKDDDSLMLDGPDEVIVEVLGEVDGPRAILEDGETPEGLAWVSNKPEVAVVEDGRVRAVGPGDTIIQGTWRNQTVVWHLVVDPAISVRFVRPTLSLTVGQQASFEVALTVGDTDVPPEGLAWSAKPASVITVDGASGKVTAVGPGTGWLVVQHGTAEAMVEVVVTQD